MIAEAAEEQAIAALATGASLADSAVAGSMSARTLRRRLRNRDFLSRLALKRRVVSRELDENLRALAREAVLVMRVLMRDEDYPVLQFKTANAVLQMWNRTRGFENEQRVDELEVLAEEQSETIAGLAKMLDRFIAEADKPTVPHDAEISQ